MARAPARVFAWLTTVLALASCSGSTGNGRAVEPPARQRLTLFFTTELKGQLEPCGCTSDPLGDMARWAALIGEARRRGEAVLYMDGGSTLFEQSTLTASRAGQERLTADLMASALTALAPTAIGFGPTDLADGAKGTRLPRMAANLDAHDVAIAPSRVVDAGGVKVGVFGVVSPRALGGLGVAAGDPVASAKQQIAALRQDGARIVVGLLHMPRTEARDLVRDAPGIDFALVGADAPDPTAGGRKVAIAPDKVGATWLIEPASKGQVVSRVDIALGAGDGMADALGAARIAPLEAEVDALAKDVAGWKAAADADPAFVAQKQAELDAARAKVAALKQKPIQPPATGSYFTLAQIEIKKALACDAGLVAQKRALDRAIGEANLAAAKGVKPPVPAKGAAGYVGSGECEMCHASQVELWSKTKHAQAWETLEAVGKQLDLDCVGCHLTGWDKPGGSNLAFNEALRDVQCEACHGPGSLHVESNGQRRETLTRSPPAELCSGSCHTPEHSDTFAFDAYLRDVVGEGHGAARRAALGDGPTGHALRSAALAKAGKAIGAGCPK
jgi:hypothetical protein